ncbi:MAG: hypothetical protein EZS28_003568 [Streblomastix strix]|uniref:Uncharacterized protein n=1 Tax=Streblomastix strix TaxID=222440 RepID=A0A5J4X2E1_9EUKA|nr:MAG: hypothetical protein EZS28_003568 [Streblomastix strix]
MFQLGLNKTENFKDQLVNCCRLSLLATGKAQKVHDYLARVLLDPDTFETYSETARQKMAENKKVKDGNFRISHICEYKSKQTKRGFMIQKMQVSNKQRQREIVEG